MAASVITAVQAKWSAIFNQAGDPPLYLDSAPLTDAAGSQERLPYAVLHDESGVEPEYFSDFGAVETGTLSVEIYGTTVSVVAGYVARAKWNGSAPNARNGLDWCTLSLTTSPVYAVSLRRANERWAYAGFDYQGVRCHVCTLTYEVKAAVAGAGY